MLRRTARARSERRRMKSEKAKDLCMHGISGFRTSRGFTESPSRFLPRGQSGRLTSTRPIAHVFGKIAQKFFPGGLRPPGPPAALPRPLTGVAFCGYALRTLAIKRKFGPSGLTVPSALRASGRNSTLGASRSSLGLQGMVHLMNMGIGKTSRFLFRCSMFQSGG